MSGSRQAQGWSGAQPQGGKAVAAVAAAAPAAAAHQGGCMLKNACTAAADVFTSDTTAAAAAAAVAHGHSGRQTQPCAPGCGWSRGSRCSSPQCQPSAAPSWGCGPPQCRHLRARLGRGGGQSAPAGGCDAAARGMRCPDSRTFPQARPAARRGRQCTRTGRSAVNSSDPTPVMPQASHRGGRGSAAQSRCRTGR